MIKLLVISLPIIVLIISFGALIYLNISIYFLSFKMEKHPLLIQRIEEVLYGICEKEGIGVFHKTYDELNKNRPEDKDKAVGMYVYTRDTEHQERVNRAFAQIKSMEMEYHLPYKEICQIAGVESTLEAEDFKLPKILLLAKIKESMSIWYYSTFFHEIGHHFAVKKLGEHTEEDADNEAGLLIKNNLPSYYLLFSAFSIRFTDGKNALSFKEKLVAFFKFIQFLIEEKAWKRKNS